MRFNSITAMERAAKLADILEELKFSSVSNHKMIFERRERDTSTVTAKVRPLAEPGRICDVEIKVNAVWRNHILTKYFRVPNYNAFRGILGRALELLEEPAAMKALKHRLTRMGVEFKPTESYMRLLERFEQARPEFTAWEIDHLGVLDGWSEADPVRRRMAESWLSQEMRTLREMERELRATKRPEHREMAKGFRDTFEFLRTFSNTPKYKLN